MDVQILEFKYANDFLGRVYRIKRLFITIRLKPQSVKKHLREAENNTLSSVATMPQLGFVFQSTGQSFALNAHLRGSEKANLYFAYIARNSARKLAVANYPVLSCCKVLMP